MHYHIPNRIAILRACCMGGIVLVLLSATPYPCSADTVSWDGGGDGISYIDPLNWDTDLVPVSTDEAIIDVAGVVTVLVDAAAGSLAVGTIVSTEDFLMTGGSLDVQDSATFSNLVFDGASFTASNVTVNGEVAMYGGTALVQRLEVLGHTTMTNGRFWTVNTNEASTINTLTISDGEFFDNGSLLITGLVDWSGGQIGRFYGLEGRVDFMGPVNIRGTATKSMGREIYHNHNTMSITNSGLVRQWSGGGFINHTNGIIDFQDDGDFDGESPYPEYLINHGLIVKSGGAGTMEETGHLLLSNSVSGEIRCESGTLTLRSRMMPVAGTLSVSNGARLRLMGGTLGANPIDLMQGGLLTGAGILRTEYGLNCDGTIRPTGLLKIELSPLTLGSNSHVDIGIGGATPGVDYGSIRSFDGASPFHLDGTLSLALTNGYSLALGDQFVVMQSPFDFTGRFAVTNLPPAEPPCEIVYSTVGSSASKLVFEVARIPITLHVDPNGTNPVAPYLAWETAATNLQQAIDEAIPGDVVLATNGVYDTGSRPTPGQTLASRIVLTNNVIIRSVNGADETFIEGADAMTDPDAFGNGSNATRCVYMSAGVLEGFTLRGGRTGKGSAGTAQERNGGGAYLEGSGTLRACVLTGNIAFDEGGGAYGGTLNHCVVTKNRCINEGGGTADSAVNNSIIYDNNAGSDADLHDSTAQYSCSPALTPGFFGNITNAPLLLTTAHISSNSPCVAAGSSTYSAGTDVDGEVWLDPPSMGCDEFAGAGTVTGALTVAIDGPATVLIGYMATFTANIVGAHAGLAWDFDDATVVTDEPCPTQAWTSPGSFDVVLTAFSDTFPGGVAATQTVTVLSEAASTIYVSAATGNNGNDGTSWATAKQSIQAGVDAQNFSGGLVLVTNGLYDTGGGVTPGYVLSNRVVITKDIVVRSVNGAAATAIRGFLGSTGVLDSNAVRCVYMSDGLLDGFTLTNGNTRTIAEDGQVDYLYDHSGAGALLEDGAVIQNSTFIKNWSQSRGGGVAGGLVRNSRFLLNGVFGTGAGAAFATVENSLLSRNFGAGNAGGAFQCTLRNCTVTANRGGGNGVAGIRECEAVNSIIYHNLSGSAPSVRDIIDSTVSYSCSAFLAAGFDGNINDDPRLITSYQLASDSPTLGAGSAAETSGTDLDGEAWLSPPAMGCDELYAGSATGPLFVAVVIDQRTTFNIDLSVGFFSEIEGTVSGVSWDFGDGTVLSNAFYVTHAWTAPGNYDVVLTAYNDDAPGGVAVTQTVTVVDSTIYVASTGNDANDGLSWATAKETIQGGVDVQNLRGGVVLVTNGVYDTGGQQNPGASLSNRVYVIKDIVLRSVNGAEFTAIVGAPGAGGGNGPGATRGILMNQGLFEGFTVMGGYTETNGIDQDMYAGGGNFEEATTVRDCVFKNNSAHRLAGGVRGGQLFNCLITSNTVTGEGNPVTFGFGGGAFQAFLTDCTVSDNVAGQKGGGVYACTVDRSIITRNTSKSGAGANRGTINNSAVYNNHSTELGGGGSRTTFRNSTVGGNFAAVGGGGLYASTSINNIVYFNASGSGSENDLFSPFLVENTCSRDVIQGVSGNITNDPKLVSTFYLSSNSPCIGAARFSEVVGNDFNGDAWLNPPSMGCDEFNSTSSTGSLSVAVVGPDTVSTNFSITLFAEVGGVPNQITWDLADGTLLTNSAYAEHAWAATGSYDVVLTVYNTDNPSGVSATQMISVVDTVIHVAPGGSDGNDGLTWSTAKETIQGGVDAQPVPGGIVLVSNGVYNTGGRIAARSVVGPTNRVLITSDIVVRSLSGPQHTFIEGAPDPDSGPFRYGSGTNAVRCVYMESATLEGFTLRHGHTASFEGIIYSPDQWGGGVFGGTLNNCILEANKGYSGGGAALATLNDCRLINNTNLYTSNENGGGGAAARVTLNHCVVSNNSSLAYGGGLYLCVANESVIIDNDARLYGGAADRSTLRNCVVANNTAGNAGGGLYDLNDHPQSEADNCTVVGNSAGTEAGGSYGYRLRTSILYDNTAPLNPNYTGGSIDNTATLPLPDPGIGSGNITEAPVFVDSGSYDFRLDASSSGIDQGQNLPWMTGAIDLAGNDRILNGTVDMGAYEFFFSGDLAALLEGAYEAGLSTMRNDLILPLNSPYTAGPAMVSDVPSNITDWVLVEIRDTNDFPVFSRSAFLRTDGEVVQLDGTDNTFLEVSPMEDYYLLVKHRNHQTAMTPAPIAFTNRLIEHDFRLAETQYFGGTNAAVQVDAGLWGARLGDVDGDGRVGAVDASIYLSQAGSTGGYFRSDVNLDGAVDAIDLELIQQKEGTLSTVPRAEVGLSPSMRITPNRQTVIAGERVDLAASDNSGPVSWAMTQDPSGGSLNTNGGTLVTYTAGSTAGVVDVVQAWDPNNRLAQTFVNVISSNDAAAIGKAVIIAGGKSLDDPVWKATENLADKAFNVFRYRGYSKNFLQYLSFGSDHDVDDNGLLDDVTAPKASSNDVESVLTSWVGNTDNLVVYMVDHGADADGSGVFRLNGDTLLPASTVDRWLDDLQDANPGLHVILVLDFCYAGSYLDELSYAGDPDRRIVVSSAADDQLTYFIAAGSVSFSEFFFNGVIQGLDVSDSFTLARDAMSLYQDAWLDDTQDGAYTGADGANAAGRYIGATFVAGKDFPIIGTVFGNQLLTDGSEVTLWVDNIASFYPLQRVWCVVIPPNFDPDPRSGIPVVDVSERDLAYNDEAGRWEVDFDGFSEPGTYLINFYAQDIWQSVSPPKLSAVVQNDFVEKLILVAGGPTDVSTWPAIQATVNQASEVFRARLLSNNNTLYLSASAFEDHDGDGTNDVDGLVNAAELQDAIQTWADDSSRLTVMLVGRATNGMFRLNASESLTAADLDSWLDTYQRSNRAVNVIMEFPGAEGFVAALQPPTGQDRITLGSCSSNRLNILTESLSFSSFFLAELFEGKTIGEAANSARRTIRRASGNIRQRAVIDDNGNGGPNEKNIDGLFASSQYIGVPFVTGEDAPVIGAVTPFLLLTTETQAVLYAENVSDADGISSVVATVTTPTNNIADSGSSYPLTWTNSRYELVYDGFLDPGVYTFTFTATDTVGEESKAVQTSVLKADSDRFAVTNPAFPDVYEDDDTLADATFGQIPIVQHHSFHTSNDVDWVRFYATTQFLYDIETLHLTNTIDTVIDLYREEVDGSLTLIDHVDEFGFDDGELTGLDFPSNGFYVAKISQDVSNGWAPGGYFFGIYVPAGSGWGIYTYVVNDIRQELVTGANVQLRTAGGSLLESKQTTSQGAIFEVDPANYRLEAEVPAGYVASFGLSASQTAVNENSAQYGNPYPLGSGEFEEIAFSGSGRYIAQHIFLVRSVATVSGSVLSGFDGEALGGAAISFTRNSDGVIFDRFEWPAYGAPWFSDGAGAFPGTVYLPTGDSYTMTVSEVGYLPAMAAIPTTMTGQMIPVGTIVLDPADGNMNSIPDPWEFQYFMGLVSTTNDIDLDGADAFHEWVANTDPTNGLSRLVFDATRVAGNGQITLNWPVSPDRTYSIYSIYSLDDPNTTNWMLRFGPMPSGVGQTNMTWTDSGPAAVQMFYQIDVQAP